MKLVCLSDTHGEHGEVELPEGDVLIHAGDFCQRGRLEEVEAFLDWFDSQPFQHKILVAGNHDEAFEREETRQTACRWAREVATYLEDESVVIEGRLFYGSPWILKDNDWAFMKPEEQLTPIWEEIPDETDVLITHGPPRGIFDEFQRTTDGNVRTERIGSVGLKKVIDRVRPEVHVFGHNHFQYGTLERDGTTFINASLPEGGNGIVYEPVVLDL